MAEATFDEYAPRWRFGSSMKRPPKKNDTLEVRLPEETKQAFMAHARAEGRSASEIVRDFIETYLARPLTKKELRMYVRPTFEIAAAVALVIGIVTLTPTPSRADSPLQQIYDRYDENKNGEVTEAEYAMSLYRSTLPKGASIQSQPPPPDALPSSGFSGMDLNKDGKLTREEFRKFHREIAIQMFNRVDNADGKLTLAEITTYYAQNWSAEEAEKKATAMMARSDADKDGVLTADEYGMQ